jgi:hypothetical protein
MFYKIGDESRKRKNRWGIKIPKTPFIIDSSFIACVQLTIYSFFLYF